MIIVRTGKYKNKRLKESDRKITRPTKDITKLGLINILKSRINNLNNNTFLDLFAGTGQISIEVYSNSLFKNIIINELNLVSFKVILNNLNLLNDSLNNIYTFNLDYLKLIENLKENKELLPISVIYLDPPYKSQIKYDFILELKKLNLINENTLIIYERDEDLDNSFINNINLDKIKMYKYGRSRLYLISLN